MTSKEFELIKEMLQMQKKLDEAIMKEYGLTEINEENLRMAILDEVGELTHELKGNWCWWKKTQAPVDTDKFPSTPTNCFIDNEDVNGKIVPDKLDRKFYINMAKERVQGYGI